nr:cytochrome c-type biogenesis protein [Porphyrobacter sp. GA68]
MAAAALAACLIAWTAVPAAAQDALPPAPYAYRELDDSRQEAAARALMHDLRCVTCQGQSIADSDAPMAGDMRHFVRTRIAAGQNAEEVRGWLEQRYGDYISYRPSFGRATWPLFVLPVLLGLIALVIILRRVGGTRSAVQ